MKEHDLLEAVGGINEKYINNAGEVKIRNNAKTVYRWIAAPACLCLIVASIITIQHINSSNVVTDNNHAGTAQEHILDTPQEMIVKIVDWGGDGFRVTVVDAEENSVFTESAELTVVFDENTVFTLSDGSTIIFNPDDVDSTSISSAVGWPEGSIVRVVFTAYEDYLEGNHFYNRATGSYLELAK